MANKPKYSTIQQHQPLYAPKGWNEEEKRFVRTLQGILEDIYKRYGRLGMNDLSKVFRGTVNGLESDMGAVQGNVTTLAGAFEQLNTAVTTLNAAKLAKTELLDAVYPIGSLYMSVNAADPNTLFGGTWERLKDRFLLAAGDTYAAGATGGEAAHTLTVEEMPSHNHSLSDPIDKNSIKLGSMTGDANWALTKRAASYDYNLTTNNTGGGAAHNNMPPYLTVYMWKRTT
ncbi:MAG: hypothetical protein MRZ98_01265 [Clostridiales bacterium]|nr:hypothetical protein [Clostridiales bacterium]